VSTGSVEQVSVVRVYQPGIFTCVICFVVGAIVGCAAMTYGQRMFLDTLAKYRASCPECPEHVQPPPVKPRGVTTEGGSGGETSY